MKVLFIYPSIDCPPGINHGLASLSGVLKAHGHDTRLIHVNEALGPVPSWDEIAGEVQRHGPDLVGISAMTQQFLWSCDCARVLRERFDLPIVIGGVHATMAPEEVIRTGLFDYVCVGEGDNALSSLVDTLARGGDPKTCRNIWAWNHGHPVANPVGPFPDLKELPPKDFDLFDVPRIVQAKKGWMGMITSRGCPYRCTYCFNRGVVERYIQAGAAKGVKDYLRHYPVERIMAELHFLRGRSPEINTWIFDDDLFTLNKQYVAEFSSAYRREGEGVRFVVNAHVQAFSDDVAAMLADAGCAIVKFGVESGSDRVRREVLARRMSNSAIQQAVEVAEARGIHTSGFIMFGLPRETKADILETLELCARIRLGRFRWAVFFPYPGTVAYDMALEDGLFDPEVSVRMGNYFAGSCLRFGEEHDLFIDKLVKAANWWVNALSDWPSAPIYRDLVRELESLDRDRWEERKTSVADRDREISTDLMRRGIPHYSIRYSPVMGVRSDFVMAEEARMGDLVEATD